ncbi:MAG: hypothetical protein GY838_13000 [bacterium]|nr:hypothetical protein [bacterium]
MSCIDQDDLGIEPLVWWGSGEVVGNWVDVTIRRVGEIYKWFARVQDPGGFTAAETGLEMDLDLASTAAATAAAKMLLVWDEDEDEE